MSKVLRLAIADPDDNSRESLKAILLSLESVWLDAECSRYEFFADVVAQSTPDIAIINLDSDCDKALDLLGKLISNSPSVGVMAVSGTSDGQVILKTIRAGAKEFVSLPVTADELVAAIERVGKSRSVPTGETPTEEGKRKIIAVAGTTGGVGSTSIAVNMATILASRDDSNVVLMDLDMALGDTDVFLDIIPEYTLLDVTQNVARLDLAFLRKSLTKHDTGVYLLPRPVQLQDVSEISATDLERVINLMGSSFSHLIIDLSKSFHDLDMAALEAADEVLLVTQLDLPCLRNTVRLLSSMEEYPGLRDKFKVIVNRVGLQSGQISLKKAQDTIRDDIYWQIPNDYGTMVEVRNNGVPLLEQAPKAPITHAIRQMTEDLLGFSREGAAGDKNAKAGGIFGFLKTKTKS